MPGREVHGPAEEQPQRQRFVQTPAQTIGPFFGFALPYDGDAQLVPGWLPEAVHLHGFVMDGEGAPVPDALLEIWQPDPQGRVVQEPGSRARRGGQFTGFGRTHAGVDGSYDFTTLVPGPTRSGVRFALLTVFARGLLQHLFTRVYFMADGQPEPSDALLDSLPAPRRRTLFAVPDGAHSYRFDVRLQGEQETVFLDYPGDT